MWSSPISYEATEFARMIRESLERLNYIFVRDLTSKTYSRFVVMIPMMGGAQVFRYTVEYPAKFVIQCYDTYPGTKSGLMPFLEVETVGPNNEKAIELLLRDIAKDLERPPWQFTRGQRLLVGFLLPEFRKARKAWAEFGFDTSKKKKDKKNRDNKNRDKKKKDMKNKGERETVKTEGE